MLIKPGPATSAMSGKQGGTVASRNRYGQYFRQFSVPVNPATGPQESARSRLTSASQGWALLSDAQRQAWTDYANLTPVLNRVGDSIILSGQAMFVKVNAFRLQVPGEAIIGVAPTTPGLAPLPNAGSFDWSLDVSDGGMVIGAPAIWTDLGLLAGAGDILEVRISPPLSPGTKFFNGPFQSALAPALGTVNGAAPDSPIPLDVTIVAGQRYILEWRQQASNGKTSNWARSGVQIVAA